MQPTDQQHTAPKATTRTVLRAVAPFAVYLVLYALVPRFAHEQQLTTLIYIGISALLLAVGLNPLMGYAGQISLGHAAFYGVGAYMSAILTTRPVSER